MPVGVRQICCCVISTNQSFIDEVEEASYSRLALEYLPLLLVVQTTAMVPAIGAAHRAM